MEALLVGDPCQSTPIGLWYCAYVHQNALIGRPPKGDAHQCVLVGAIIGDDCGIERRD